MLSSAVKGNNALLQGVVWNKCLIVLNNNALRGFNFPNQDKILQCEK